MTASPVMARLLCLDIEILDFRVNQWVGRVVRANRSGCFLTAIRDTTTSLPELSTHPPRPLQLTIPQVLDLPR